MRVKQINAPLIRPALTRGPPSPQGEKGAPPTRSPLPRPVPQRPMSLDVIDLRSFYASALGKVARRFVSRLVRARWKNCTGLSIMGIGYACPYLDLFVPEAVRVLAFMPAEQGVVNWPSSGRSASALVEATMMPLPNACIDRVLVVHALESGEHPRELLEEIWRILTPGGRMILIAPNRSGLWARIDTTPFGQGQPYSRGQLRELMRDTLFSPTYWGEALYVPPLAARRGRSYRRGDEAGLPADWRPPCRAAGGASARTGAGTGSGGADACW